jgi:hypothetical protein
MAQSTTTDTTATVPDAWPGGFGLFKYSKNAITKNTWLLLGLILGTIVISTLFGSKSQPAILQLLGNLINVVLQIVMMFVFLAGVRGKEFTFDSVKDRLLNVTWKYILQSIVLVLIYIGSLIALIVPFFFVLPRTLLAPYYILDKDMGPIEAIKASWNDTQGHSGKVYGIIGVSLLMAISCLVLIGFYLLFMYSAALAILYVFLTRKK